jgi:hypothetical protein
MEHDFRWDLVPAVLGGVFVALTAGYFWSERPERYIYEYQTLIAGAAAIFAAAICGLHTHQIRQSIQRHRQQYGVPAARDATLPG